jgi:hypothetical protein
MGEIGVAIDAELGVVVDKLAGGVGDLFGLDRVASSGKEEVRSRRLLASAGEPDL